MAKLAALMVVTLLGLLGSVPCQGSSTAANPLAVPGVVSSSSSRLTVGYYNNTCPTAEDTVNKVVEKAMAGDRGVGAVLIRLMFHDCFVGGGCDASILLTKTDGSSEPTERSAGANVDLDSGYKVIEDAKKEIEKNATCSGKVSCADIIAFAASHAARILSSRAIDIKMPAGRLDSRVSRQGDADANLPSPSSSNLADFETRFSIRGLDFNAMVALFGAHSIGKSQCGFFKDRLPPNSSDMDSGLAKSLKATCRNRDDFRVVQDNVTADALDNQYFKNVQNHKVLFTSDAMLYSSVDPRAKQVVDGFAKDGTAWNLAFAKAMVRMGKIIRDDTTPSAPPQEIRKTCSIYNNNTQ